MRTLNLLIIVAFLSLTSVSAQEKKPTPSPKPAEVEDVVRVTTELVQTDVTVFDKDGKFVSGLKPEQFELVIDGQPQPIAFFDSVETGRNERAALKAARDNKRPQPVTEPEASSDQGRTILFFVNDVHLAPASLALANKTITQFIDHMLGPND